MRDRHICPKCDHDEILRIAEVPDVTNPSRPSVRDHERAGAATAEATRDIPSFALRLARLPDEHKGSIKLALELVDHGGPVIGLVRAYACRRCGYTELYTEGVEDIPIDGTQVSLLKGKKGDGPYR